jgi:hypothetical protein
MKGPRMPGYSPQYEVFRKQGYVELPGFISPAELAAMQEMFDHDRSEFAYFWRPFGDDQIINCDPLLTSPAVDDVIRHPRIFPIIQELMGGAIVFSEICLRYMPPRTGELRRGWHRDRPHFEEHAIRLDYPQLMVYLTDVHPGTHCFSISPEAADAPILGVQEQLARGGVVDLHGPAGTAIIFNSSVLHTATARTTEIDRKTIQIYYGHADRVFLSNDSFIPPTLWRDHVDPATREFYGKLNGKSRVIAESCDRAVSRPVFAR